MMHPKLNGSICLSVCNTATNGNLICLFDLEIMVTKLLIVDDVKHTKKITAILRHEALVDFGGHYTTTRT